MGCRIIKNRRTEQCIIHVCVCVCERAMKIQSIYKHSIQRTLLLAKGTPYTHTKHTHSNIQTSKHSYIHSIQSIHIQQHNMYGGHRIHSHRTYHGKFSVRFSSLAFVFFSIVFDLFPQHARTH